jgi:hypothetical protein
MPDIGADGFTLALVLTAAGATVGGALITGIIGMLKKLGGLGAWIEASHEPLVAFILSAVLVIVAYSSTLTQFGGDGALSIEGGFAAFLAWYGIATIAMGTHAVTSSVANRSSGT